MAQAAYCIVVAMTIIFVVYSLVGGLVASAWTDVFQGCLIIVLSFIIPGS
jgi:Na+/proline symporter